jgi:hypothetical protein
VSQLQRRSGGLPFGTGAPVLAVATAGGAALVHRPNAGIVLLLFSAATLLVCLMLLRTKQLLCHASLVTTSVSPKLADHQPSRDEATPNVAVSLFLCGWCQTARFTRTSKVTNLPSPLSRCTPIASPKGLGKLLLGYQDMQLFR